MKRSRTSSRTIGFLAAVLVLVLASERVGIAQDDWAEYRSRTYRVLGNADSGDTRAVAADLEGFNGAVERFFRNMGIRRLPPATLLVLDGQGDLRRAGLDSADQYFVVGADKAFAVITDAGDDESLEDLLHTYVHRVAEAMMPNVPPWLTEGLAAFYATTRQADSVVVTGVPIDRYVRQIRDADSLLGPFGLAEAAPAAHDADQERGGLFYAESWALVHYLVTRDNGDGHDRTAEMARRMAGGESFEAAAEASFGLGFRELLAGFESQVAGRGAWPRLTLAFEDDWTSVERVGEVPPVEAATTLGEILSAAGFPLEAERQLARAVELGPNSSRPYTALAPLLIDQGRFDEVRFGIGRALGGPDVDHLAHYYYARSLILENEEPTDAQRTRVRRELEASIDKAPTFSDAYHELAASYLGTDEGLDAAVRLLETALDLSPENPAYLLTFSRVLIEQGRFDDARDVLLPLLDDARSPELSEQAAALMQAIEGQRSRRGLVGDGFAEITSDSRARPATPTANPSPAPSAGSEAGDGIRLTRVVDGLQVSGLLTLIDCRDGLALTVEADSTSYVFHTDVPDRVVFSGGTGNVGREVQCGIQAPPPNVVVTFRPAGEESAFRGVPDRVEFLED